MDLRAVKCESVYWINLALGRGQVATACERCIEPSRKFITVNKMREIFRLAEEMSAFKVGICSLELVG
jgi:hypothetical protein